ncbi:MAG: insulinase family protein [Bacteroidales bacterium]
MKKIWILCMALAVFTLSFAQKGEVDLKQPLPIDKNVRVGTLSNGLKYYIRKNAKPENRVMLQLATNAGSINENDAQVGLAHFCEHMLFNGTKNFPKSELINFLQKTGMRFGGDINAYTSFDQTVYMLEIPTDQVGLLDKGLQVLEDWAHQASFDSSAIDEERGIIIEEWRMGLGAQDRMRKKILPIIVNNSLYAKRLPIGTIENLKTFKHETIRKFYKDFYRPNLQAVVVVGDVNLDEMEAKIKQQFGRIPNPKNLVERIEVDIPGNTEPLFAIATDKEATSTTVAVLYKHPHKVTATVGDYRKDIISMLASEMLNARFSELGQEPECPFSYAVQFYGQYVRPMDAYQLYSGVKENQIKQALAMLLRESYRVEQHGFLQTELARAKEAVLMRYENMAKEADKTPSPQLAEEYIGNFLEKEPIPGIEFEYALVQQLLPTITLAEVSADAQSGITEENIVVLIQAPDKPEIQIPSKAELLNILASAKEEKVEPYVDKFKAAPLVELPVKSASGAKIISSDPKQGITKVKLSNGIVVAMKPTKFKNDEILFSAYNLGGTSLAEQKDYLSAIFSTKIEDVSGLGDFDNTELNKKLQGKNISFTTNASDTKMNITGSASPADLETLLQLNYLNFTAARKDNKAFQSFISKMKNQMKFMGASPMYAFIDTLFTVSSNYDPRSIFLPTPAEIESVDVDKAYQFYTEQFSDPGSFNFYMVGNFEVNDSLLSLLETYIGSLPVKESKRMWVDRSVALPEKVIDGTILKGSEDQGMVGIVMSAYIPWDIQTRKSLEAFKEIVSIKLLEVIREQMGGVYSPSVQLEFSRYPQATASLMVMFGCDPKRADTLTQAVFDQMSLIMKEGPIEVDVNKVKELDKRSYEVSSKENSFWLNALSNADYMGLDLSLLTPEAQAKIIDKVTAKTIQKIAKKYFNVDRYVRMILAPDPAEMEEE